MALTRVQSNIAHGSSTAPSVDIGSIPAAGDLVIVSIAVATTGRTIAISGYTQIPTDGNVSNSTCQHAIFYKIADGAGGTDVITGSISGSSVGWRIIAVQYHDSAGGTWTLDKSAHSSGSSTHPASGTTAASTVAAEVWAAILTNGGNITQSSPTNSFSLVQGAATAAGAASYFYERIVAATGAASTSTTTPSSRAWVGTVATFYSGAGGGGGGGTPANTVAPAVTGTTVVGNTLSCSTGTWTNTPTSYAYQWQRDVFGSGSYSNIASATSNTYALIDTDDGSHIRCVVIATNATGSSLPANSNAVGLITEPAPTNTSVPIITGNAIQYDSLDVSSGTWTNMGGHNPTYGIQWQTAPDNLTWADVPAAIGSTFTLRTADVGNYIRAVLTATNTGGTASADTDSVGPIQGVPVYPYVDLRPSYDWDNVFNRWTGKRDDGSPYTWEDLSSQDDYFLRAKQITSLVSTDAELVNQLQWKTALFSQPMDRVDSIVVMPLRHQIDLTPSVAAGSGTVTGVPLLLSAYHTPAVVDTEAASNQDTVIEIDASLSREIGDRIVVLETPPGFADEQEVEYMIQHISGTVEQGPYVSAKFEFQLWPSSIMDFWIVGDAAKSRAGLTTRPSY